jgi:hypothetical protein
VEEVEFEMGPSYWTSRCHVTRKYMTMKLVHCNHTSLQNLPRSAREWGQTFFDARNCGARTRCVAASAAHPLYATGPILGSC